VLSSLRNNLVALFLQYESNPGDALSLPAVKQTGRLQQVACFCPIKCFQNLLPVTRSKANFIFTFKTQQSSCMPLQPPKETTAETKSYWLTKRHP